VTAPVPEEPKTPRKASVRAQKPRVAPGKGKAGKKGHPRQEGPQSHQSRQTGEAGGNRPRGQQDRQGSGPAPAQGRGHARRDHALRFTLHLARML